MTGYVLILTSDLGFAFPWGLLGSLWKTQNIPRLHEHDITFGLQISVYVSCSFLYPSFLEWSIVCPLTNVVNL